MKQQLISFYLAWVNDFITVEYMAEYHGLTVEHTLSLIELGKQYHEANI